MIPGRLAGSGTPVGALALAAAALLLTPARAAPEALAPTPTPGARPPSIDGEYGYLDPDPPQWWSCLRCADYRPSGGAWNLRFVQGRMTLSDEVSGFTSHASYHVVGGAVELFDDPVCPWDRGRYTWRVDDQGLTLEPVADACSFGLRAENLGRGVWANCRPPDERSAWSDAWPRPAGCVAPAVAPLNAALPPRGVSVSVRAGDARLISPTILAIPANTENQPAPPGVAIIADPEVVRYGLYLILWRSAPWAEAAFDEATGPVGVQFWGPSTMGSARVLLDGVEVWRGQVVPLGELRSQYGGYIEVAGFPSGRHVLRVERLDLDARPVRVMFFGIG